MKKTIVEQESYGQSYHYIGYSLRECEGKQVLVIFTGESQGQGGILTHLYGIFKLLEDARKSLINTGCYIGETKKHCF